VRRAVILGSDRREGFNRTQKKHWLDQAGRWEVRLGREGRGRLIRVQSRPHCGRLDRPLLRADGRMTIEIFQQLHLCTALEGLGLNNFAQGKPNLL
jgi:hypothetical protein